MRQIAARCSRASRRSAGPVEDPGLRSGRPTSRPRTKGDWWTWPDMTKSGGIAGSTWSAPASRMAAPPSSSTRSAAGRGRPTSSGRCGFSVVGGELAPDRFPRDGAVPPRADGDERVADFHAGPVGGYTASRASSSIHIAISSLSALRLSRSWLPEQTMIFVRATSPRGTPRTTTICARRSTSRTLEQVARQHDDVEIAATDFSQSNCLSA